MASRRYDQRLRAEAAEDTRRRILDAVYRRLREAPTEPVSVERVADLARVSRSTVYLVFGSRAGLFDALGEDLRKSGGFDRPAVVDDMADPRASLLASVRASAPIFAKHRDVLRVLYSMAQLDPDAVGGAIQRMGNARSADLMAYARRLSKRNELKKGLSVADATHLLWAFTGFELFDQLFAGRDLSPDAVASLVVIMIESAVLGG
ncbi:MAG: TetR/AcrR family transcriptional regulator [Kofleriaceae bacterium]